MQYGRPGNSHSITTTFVPLPDESGGSGLLVSGRQNVTISGFTLVNFRNGISFSYASASTAADNIVEGATFAIKLKGGSANIINGNTITRSDFGIYLDASADDNTLADNIVSGCNTAIRIYSSNRSRVEKNRVTDNNSYGIAVSDSQGSRISGNFASGNGLDGIRLYRSPGSIIEHNQSLNNV